MYTASTALPSDQESILGFLERRGFVYDPWLAWSVNDALGGCAAWMRVILCRRDDELAGVAAISWHPQKGIEAGYQARADAVDPEAAAALVSGFPVGASSSISLFDPVMQDYFSSLAGETRSDGDLYYTVDADRFRPVGGDEVVELSSADAGLFEGCENQPNWENESNGHRMLAIVRDGRAVTSLWSGLLPPKMPSGRWVATIGPLHTETPHRRKGLATQVVSRVTELILHEGNVPIYWTEPENVASQELCKGLGYWQYAQAARFKWVRT